MMIRPLYCFILCLLAPLVAAGEIGPNTHQSTPGFSENLLDVSDSVTLAGKVDVETLAQTYPQGVLLIDLRTAAEEGLAEEQQQATLAGIRYENVPVSGPVITDDGIDQLQQLLAGRKPEEHVVIHCASGNRAGMMWGALQIESGEDAVLVLESLEPIVTKEPVTAALREYAGLNES